MKIRLGGGQSNDGYYGGVGSKPAARTWTPPVHEADDPDAQAPRVPKRLRDVHLRRRTRPRMEPMPPIILTMLGLVVLALLFLFGRALLF